MSSTVDSLKFSAKTQQRWKSLVSLGLFCMGLSSIIWGCEHLISHSEVPLCVYPVDELLAEGREVEVTAEDDSISLAMDTSDQLEPPLSPPITTRLAVASLGQIQVEITGAIKQPGVYNLGNQARLGELIELAGGFSQDADLTKVTQQLNLSEKLSDEQKIKIPGKQEAELAEWLAQYCQLYSQSVSSNSGSSGTSGASTSSLSDDPLIPDNESNNDVNQQDCISLNNATSAQLQTLTGVGEKTAQLIIEGRPYSKLTDLLDVKGIGDVTFAKLESFICL